MGRRPLLFWLSPCSIRVALPACVVSLRVLGSAVALAGRAPFAVRPVLFPFNTHPPPSHACVDMVGAWSGIWAACEREVAGSKNRGVLRTSMGSARSSSCKGYWVAGGIHGERLCE